MLYIPEELDNNVDNRTNKTENGNFEFFEPVDEKFHLLFGKILLCKISLRNIRCLLHIYYFLFLILGICMEALCAQRDMSVENTISVLLSLVTLLDAPENRARLLKDR